MLLRASPIPLIYCYCHSVVISWMLLILTWMIFWVFSIIMILWIYLLNSTTMDGQLNAISCFNIFRIYELNAIAIAMYIYMISSFNLFNIYELNAISTVLFWSIDLGYWSMVCNVGFAIGWLLLLLSFDISIGLAIDLVFSILGLLSLLFSTVIYFCCYLFMISNAIASFYLFMMYWSIVSSCYLLLLIYQLDAIYLLLVYALCYCCMLTVCYRSQSLLMYAISSIAIECLCYCYISFACCPSARIHNQWWYERGK